MVEGIVAHLPLLLKPDPSRVVIRPFAPADDDPEFASSDRTRAQRIADRVLALEPADVFEELHGIVATLSDHHRDVESVLLRRFHDINGLSIAAASVSDDQAHLIGGYFSEEYAFEAAALFNPRAYSSAISRDRFSDMSEPITAPARIPTPSPATQCIVEPNTCRHRA